MRPVRVLFSMVVATLLLVSATAAALPTPDRPDRWFDDHVYHHHADLTIELQQLQEDHPQYVDMTSIGTSVQGRELWTVRVTDPSVPAAGKMRIYVDGEHHGNEQLGGELVILLLHHLLEDQDDPLVQQVLAGSIVWMTPMLNPDGVARDTRSNQNGIDLNRNYPYEHRPGGSRGDTPASEPEVQGNVAFIEGADLDLYVTMHTGVVRLIYPWAWTEVRPPDFSMYDNLTDIAEGHGVTYAQASRELYIAYGTSKDFAYGTLGVPSYTFEVDNEQTRMISTREDIASRLSDELALLMDWILAAPLMRANLETGNVTYDAGDPGGVSVRVDLTNSGLTPANNTTVTVQAYQGGRVVKTASTTLDIPQGDSSVATVRIGLGEGDYTLRTILDYPKRLEENTTSESTVLRTSDVSVESSLGGVTGGVGTGLLLLLLAIGVAFLYWAHRRGWWRPGLVYGRLMSKARPAEDT